MSKKSIREKIIDTTLIIGVTAYIGYLIFSKVIFSSFSVPSNSMEPAILSGETIWVNKVGFHLCFNIWGKEFDIPGFRKLERGDVAVFHFPEGDSVLLNSPTKNIYQLRAEGKFAHALEATKDTVIFLPVRYRPNYVKRIVGLPGDTVAMVNGQLYYNHQQCISEYKLKHLYKVFGQEAKETKLVVNNIWKERQSYTSCNITKEEASELSLLSCVDSVVQYSSRHRSCGYYFPEEIDSKNRWSAYRFGPIIIPKKKKPLHLTTQSLPYYRRLISVYEGNLLRVSNDSVFINGKHTVFYTPRQDYYFVMGDNRDISIDSRNWGFVPYDHVIGKVFCVWE